MDASLELFFRVEKHDIKLRILTLGLKVSDSHNEMRKILIQECDQQSKINQGICNLGLVGQIF